MTGPLIVNALGGISNPNLAIGKPPRAPASPAEP